MKTRRPRRAPRRRVARGRPPIAAIAIAAGGLLTAIATALPWYAPNLASVFTPLSVNGLELGAGPRVVLAIAILLVLLGAALAADEHGLYPLDRRLAWRITLTATALVAAAAVLVLYRLAILPDPADFYARRYGLYLAAIGVAVAATGAIAQVMRRSG